MDYLLSLKYLSSNRNCNCPIIGNANKAGNGAGATGKGQQIRPLTISLPGAITVLNTLPVFRTGKAS
jgi:hypothetical protein